MHCPKDLEAKYASVASKSVVESVVELQSKQDSAESMVPEPTSHMSDTCPSRMTGGLFENHGVSPETCSSVIELLRPVEKGIEESIFFDFHEGDRAQAGGHFFSRELQSFSCEWGWASCGFHVTRTEP